MSLDQWSSVVSVDAWNEPKLCMVLTSDEATGLDDSQVELMYSCVVVTISFDNDQVSVGVIVPSVDHIVPSVDHTVPSDVNEETSDDAVLVFPEIVVISVDSMLLS